MTEPKTLYLEVYEQDDDKMNVKFQWNLTPENPYTRRVWHRLDIGVTIDWLTIARDRKEPKNE
jgi:hypothetical protein